MVSTAPAKPSGPQHLDWALRAPMSERDERDLLWWFRQDFRGDLGIHSNALIFATTGCHTDGGSIYHYVEDRALIAAENLNRIARRVSLLSSAHFDTLRSAFGEMLNVDDRTRFAFGDVTEIVCRQPATRQAWRDSETDRPMLEWLGNVTRRVQSGTSETLANDKELIVFLTLTAQRSFLEAAVAYEKTRGVGGRR